MLTTRLLMDGLYALEDERVRQFLVIGAERALLFDTGFADSGVLETVLSLTDKPVDVVMTHADRDHSGGLSDFGSCRLHPGDWPMVEGMNMMLLPLYDGDICRCGDYRFEVIEIPGHTPGSVAFYDASKKLLLPGDSVQHGGPIYMFGEKRNLQNYIASLRKLKLMIPADATVLPCHSECPIDGSYIARDLEDALALRDGKLPSEPHPTMPCRVYHGAATDYLYDGEMGD